MYEHDWPLYISKEWCRWQHTGYLFILLLPVMRGLTHVAPRMPVALCTNRETLRENKATTASGPFRKVAQKPIEAWHTWLSHVPDFTCAMLENYVKERKTVNVTSDRRYTCTFFLEGFVHDMQGTHCVAWAILQEHSALPLFTPCKLFNKINRLDPVCVWWMQCHLVNTTLTSL